MDVAVILLPGILGSPLKNKYTGDSIWPVHSGFWTAWTGWSHTAKKAKMFVDDITTMNSVTEVIRPAEWKEGDIEFIADIYHDFVQLPAAQRLDTRGAALSFTPHVYVLNYNWSVSTQNNIQNIADGTMAIMAAAGRDHNATRYMYVTHSMGVLAALATALFKDWAERDEFLGIVPVAGPIPGAPEALMRLMRGFVAPPGSEIAASLWDTVVERDPQHIKGKFMPWITAKLLSNSGWKFSMLAPFIPGFADLLPFATLDRNLEKEVAEIINFHFNPNNPVTRGIGLYNEWSWAEASEHRQALVDKMKTSIRQARDLHNFIHNRQNKLNEKYKLYAVCLTGKETVRWMDIVNLSQINSLRGNRSGNLMIPDVLKGTYTSDQTGDGTVTEYGQKHNCSVYSRVYGGIDHADAFKDPNVWPHIHTAMEWIYNNHL
jgi:pimeloyl-ACP methyl ester carboxylesterase